MTIKRRVMIYGVITGVLLGTAVAAVVGYTFRKYIPSFSDARSKLVSFVSKSRVPPQYYSEADKFEPLSVPDNGAPAQPQPQTQDTARDSRPNTTRKAENFASRGADENNSLRRPSTQNLNGEKPGDIPKSTPSPNRSRVAEVRKGMPDTPTNQRSPSITRLDPAAGTMGAPQPRVTKILPVEAEDATEEVPKQARAKRAKPTEKPFYVRTKTDETYVNHNRYNYDVSHYGPIVVAKPRTRIVASTDRKFRTTFVTGTTNNKGAFQIPNPPPGFIFWKSLDDGKIHQIKISQPAGLQIRVATKANMSREESISWTSGENVSFYRIEASKNSEFGDILKVYSTRRNDIPIKYFSDNGELYIRVSGLNLNTGSWEFSDIRKVQVTN